MVSRVFAFARKSSKASMGGLVFLAGQKAARLDDRKSRFFVQKAKHSLNVMCCSLDQLLNLHSTQPAIAGSATV